MTMMTRRSAARSGFTLIEALITIAIIGVMAAAVINAFSNAAGDARRVLARQQQAVVQAAVNNWVSGQLAGSSPLTVAQTRAVYNESAPGTARTTLQRLQLVGGYLDDATYADLISEGDADKIKSHVLDQAEQYLTLPSWAAGAYPKVNLLP
jgi:prepilin-type N-terminal cleavage/methylation domain-containing protein